MSDARRRASLCDAPVSLAVASWPSGGREPNRGGAQANLTRTLDHLAEHQRNPVERVRTFGRQYDLCQRVAKKVVAGNHAKAASR